MIEKKSSSNRLPKKIFDSRGIGAIATSPPHKSAPGCTYIIIIYTFLRFTTTICDFRPDFKSFFKRHGDYRWTVILFAVGCHTSNISYYTHYTYVCRYNNYITLYTHFLIFLVFSKMHKNFNCLYIFFTKITLVVIGVLVVIGITNPYLIVPTLVLLVYFFKLRSIYSTISRQVKRLEGVGEYGHRCNFFFFCCKTWANVFSEGEI